MEPTRLYVKNVLAALAAHPASRRWPTSPAAACWRTFRACCPTALAAHLQKGSWPQTELFAWLQATAGIDDIEMNRTFNNGIGMVVVVI
jgi:phosphoribosylformylglycinamidine cyclo-ligase